MSYLACFECNGTGLKCSVCGEAENACRCEDEPDSLGVPSRDNCECCGGTGYVEVPENKDLP